MGARITAAEKNRKKRERKKHQQHDDDTAKDTTTTILSDPQQKLSENGNYQHPPSANLTLSNIEIEYIEPDIPTLLNDTDIDGNNNDDHNNAKLNDAIQAVLRFNARAASIVQKSNDNNENDDNDNDVENNNNNSEEDNDTILNLSKRKLRDMTRPTVAELKRRVQRPDLVEAHDITAMDPEFLIRLKSVPHSVPVPRHWGRKRKYLQGKRIGYDKQQHQPYQLPSYLIHTGITELRDTVMESEKEMSAKQKNRARVQVKLGAIDVDYRTLHDAFFKHQTKPKNLTKLGEVYYEGKELEMKKVKQIGQPLSATLRMALGMSSPLVPPPWLIQMQRFGPPPSYPNLRIPGLNAPLPDPSCQYGYHPNGWGKPPIDPYGRPLYGGNPFDPPGKTTANDDDAFLSSTNATSELVTSDGKTISKHSLWGRLATGITQKLVDEDDESGSEEEDDDDMEESEGEDNEEKDIEVNNLDADDGIESTLPPPSIPSNTGPVDLRKSGLDTPMSIVTATAPKPLYQVIEQKEARFDPNAVFASEIVYAIPGTTTAATVDGAESVLSKAITHNESNGKRHGKGKAGDDDDDDDDEGNIKNFKF